jgi:hypothetical protein
MYEKLPVSSILELSSFLGGGQKKDVAKLSLAIFKQVSNTSFGFIQKAFFL